MQFSLKKVLRWSIADLLDLEFFLYQDEGEDIDRLAARDREIYAGLLAKEAGSAELLRSWLTYRKQEVAAKNIALPGSLWQELLLILFGAIVLAGLCSGAGLAFSVLAYVGTQPVNVAAYFSLFVLLQIALFLLLTSSFLCNKWQGSSTLTTSLLYRLLFRLLEKLLAVVSQRANAHFSATTHLHWSAQLGILKGLRQRHGLIVFRPFFLLAQMFGISFNVSVLAVTLLKVIGSDLAFGWQTTLQISTKSVHALVNWISLPWAWFAESCVPNLKQIEGSRLILKDGIYLLANRDLASWWPFLCLSVLCYGLLPRLLLLIAGLIRQQRDLAALDFRQACFRQIIHRMRTPLVSSSARAEEQQTASPHQSEAKLFPKDCPAATGTVSSVVALIPDELFAALPFASLSELIRRRAGYQLGQLVPFWTLDKSEAEEIATLKIAMEAQGCTDVLIVHEAWQPPVQELLLWLGRLRQCLGPQSVIILALIGKPTADTVLTSPQPQHIQIWQQKLAALGDSGLQLIELAP